MPHHAASGPGRAHSRPLGVLVRDHACYFMLIRLVDHGIGVEMAFALGRLRSQDVAFKRVSALELARCCLLEALGGATMCLQLRHNRLSITTQTHVPGQCWAPTVLQLSWASRPARLF